MDKYYLSDDEIALLVSFLGGKEVYGIESQLFSSWYISSHQLIDNTLNKMMENHLISIDYDGYLHIQNNLANMIEMMMNCDDLLSVCQKTYYYVSNHKMVSLKRGMHRHCLCFEGEISYIDGDRENIDIVISDDDLSIVNEYIDNFDDESARLYLKDKIDNDDFVFDFIEKKYDEALYDYYRWDKQGHIKEHQMMILGKKNNHYFTCIKQSDHMSIKGGYERINALIDRINREVKEWEQSQ